MNSPYQNLNEDQWLLRHAEDVCSQSGEDGILRKIFEVIPPANRWCVEFGAWDGKTCSNTHALMQDGKWSGVFVEADRERFRDLLETYRGNPGAHCVNCFVTFEGENSLEHLLSRTEIPGNFDLLSIDIDGNDFHVWESLRLYQPRVVVIEFNPTIPSEVEFVQPRDMRVQQGSAPLSLIKLGKQKGYEPVCITSLNVIFVRTELFPSFHIANNDIRRLRPDHPRFHLFQLYDGTFVVTGCQDVLWQGIPIRQEKFQVLPKMFRAFPSESLNRWKRFLRRIWSFLYRRGLG
jgi:hypothetical protein